MQIITPVNQAAHHPPFEIWNGAQTPNQEIPARVETILAALAKTSHNLIPNSVTVPKAILRKIHSGRYLDFLAGFGENLNEGEYHYPSVFALRSRSEDRYSYPLTRQGFYSFDMYTPLMKATYAAALEAASSAYQAAKMVVSGVVGRSMAGSSTHGSKVVFALCRPPGHHAEFDQMGGYCYLNNAAVAAQTLLELGKVATLDVDFHHGNGTQHIFYDRSDVLTTSIHAHPDWKFPHFSGFEDETGEDKGRGFNHNFALGPGITDEQYDETLSLALAKIAKFNPKSLVVSFGADTHRDDPIGGFKLSTRYFAQMGRKITALGLPTVIVMEGGYNTEKLGKNVVSFLDGWKNI